MLKIGESVSAEILARKEWNITNINLVAGQQYKCEAFGEWTDWKIHCDANGYKSSNWILKNSEWLRRDPSHDWFVLIGAINQCNLFKIGTNQILQPSEDGMLTCFANDLPFMYWNNHGSIQLVITRTR